ncbi:MAG TPA: hypothetical protein VI248_14825 [Kineosporiaceae bacterium]
MALLLQVAATHGRRVALANIVFGAHLPLAPQPLTLPGVAVPVLAAPAPLALAWKLMWLATDRYPQGKDLYDAALLAEHCRVDQTLVQNLLRPELGAEADTFDAAAVLDRDIDWETSSTRTRP